MPDSVGLTRLLDACNFIILLGQWSKSQVKFTPEKFPKGTNLKAIRLIFSSNLWHNHGHLMAHAKEFFSLKILLKTPPFLCSFRHTSFILWSTVFSYWESIDYKIVIGVSAKLRTSFWEEVWENIGAQMTLESRGHRAMGLVTTNSGKLLGRRFLLLQKKKEWEAMTYTQE